MEGEGRTISAVTAYLFPLGGWHLLINRPFALLHGCKGATFLPLVGRWVGLKQLQDLAEWRNSRLSHRLQQLRAEVEHRELSAILKLWQLFALAALKNEIFRNSVTYSARDEGKAKRKADRARGGSSCGAVKGKPLNNPR